MKKSDSTIKISNRLDELIVMGEKLLSTRRNPPTNVIGDDRIDSQLANQWITSVQNLLFRTFGENGEHYKNFSKLVQGSLTFSPINSAFGVLKAAKDDFETDQLFEIKQLIEAEVFDDFLEQAEYLFSVNYYQPAAVIAGSVLEDGLRKLCIRYSIPLLNKPKLDQMNTDLAKAKVYNKLVQKRVTMLADIRNKAAHGEWNEFSKDDVKEMINSIRTFMEDHFG